jgi:hypothetical protein
LKNYNKQQNAKCTGLGSECMAVAVDIFASMILLAEIEELADIGDLLGPPSS